MSTLLSGAGEFVLWCLAVVIGVAVVAVGALHVWDWRMGREMERRAKR